MSSKQRESIFLSGTPETQDRANLFRSKEIREVVFPGVGMIMHSLFWVKHTFYLAANGYDPADQDHILLWASDGQANGRESLLYYCIYSNMDPKPDVTVNAGIRTTRNWLFSKDGHSDGDIYEQVGGALSQLARDPTHADFDTFVEDVFAPWFRTRCEELNVNLEEEYSRTLGPILDIENPQARKRELVGTFCDTLARLVRQNKPLRSGRNTRVISTTIGFANDLLDVATPEQREILANTEVRFTGEEAAALLGAVGRLPNGNHFLRSLLFILYLDPTTHSGGEISQQMRRVYEFAADEPEAIERTAKRYGLADKFDSVLENLEQTAFYWLLNFFMATGETITRDLLENADSPLSEADITTYFEDHETRADHFRSFFDHAEAAKRYLPDLAEELSNDVDTSRFIDTLINGINSEMPVSTLYIELLRSQGTVSEISDGHYLIESRPQNTNPASFYGIGPLTSWAATLATSVRAG